MTLVRPGILLYDGDCGFCTTSAQWIRDRLDAPDTVEVRPWRVGDEQRYGITPDEAEREIHWITGRGGVRGGADAVLSWWRTGSGPWSWLSRLLGAPLLIVVTRAGYRLIARNRQRLPGSTAACAVNR